MNPLPEDLLGVEQGSALEGPDLGYVEPYVNRNRLVVAEYPALMPNSQSV